MADVLGLRNKSEHVLEPNQRDENKKVPGTPKRNMVTQRLFLKSSNSFIEPLKDFRPEKWVPVAKGNEQL